MYPILIFLAAHWYLSLFTQTFFNHRYAAHNQFKMSSFWEKVFFVACWMFQGSSYLSPRVYAILHRLHHAYADTPRDPHSPRFDKNIFWMMWKTFNIYNDIAAGKMEVESRFLKNLTEWPKFDKFAQTWLSKLSWGGIYVLFYYYFAPSYWWFLFLPVHFLMSPIHGTVINWFAHTGGYRNFILPNTSRNIWRFDWLMLGEGYHNNHHMHPERPNFGGVKRFEWDLTYPVIKLLNYFRVIRIN